METIKMSTENSNLEVLAPSATIALERASIDSQVATAHAFPRSLEQFKKRAMSMATLDLETAESCIYSRPVGNGKVAEGASIRMAEIVAASYGNIRVAARIVEQTPRYVKCEGVAHDLESNYAGKSECLEPTVKTDGTPYSEGQRAVVAKACLSKAYRDAVFKVVPKALCKSILIAAEGVIRKEVATIEQRRSRVQQWLKQIKVDDARVFNVLGVKGWTEVTDDQLNTLTGLKTAINEQDTTIEEAFPAAAKAPKFGEQAAAAQGTTGKAPEPAASEPAKETAAKTTGLPERRAQEPAKSEEPPKSDAAAKKEGEDGDLGPAKPAAPAQNVEVPPEAVAKALEVVSFKKAEGETDDDAFKRFDNMVQTLFTASAITEGQFMSFCRKNKLAKDNQKKLQDLSPSKVVNIAKTWSTVLPQVRVEPKD